MTMLCLCDTFANCVCITLVWPYKLQTISTKILLLYSFAIYILFPIIMFYLCESLPFDFELFGYKSQCFSYVNPKHLA